MWKKNVWAVLLCAPLGAMAQIGAANGQWRHDGGDAGGTRYSALDQINASNGMFSSGPSGGGPLFRALDKKTGKTLFEMELPGNETGLSMTYMANGRQFIVVALALPVGRR